MPETFLVFPQLRQLKAETALEISPRRLQDLFSWKRFDIPSQGVLYHSVV
jgi:hypothetical protein